ncbi:tetratricopeptide repeat protein [Dyella japonica]|uniref:Tetratricopeptide repeat protein n=1 Tax=Dyella japonica A8 TaxID=1217721 RepID=A0A075K0A2_9GAMM|nr:tetratricopeptide repeat protein [Dyella japonica]AIF47265.1 hypothetical protein HY57_08235 [Dyella japonica A8]
MQFRLTYGLGAIALLAIALIYWPVVHFSFVWDDWVSFVETPWLTQGDEWKHYIFRDFNAWTYYFRPLVVGLFTMQVRLFHSAPEPMHVVSLALHLIDVALVGVLAWRCATLTNMDAARRSWVAPLCMLIYGLHPALIETVAWVGCQFDLVVTLFVLLGLIANLGIQRRGHRASVIAVIFFLAACSKEAALSFPFLLVLFDWMLFSGDQDTRFTTRIATVLGRNWPAYLGVVLAGSGYLIFRHFALGSVTGQAASPSGGLVAHLYEISVVYLHYLKVIIWPVDGMNVIHPYMPGDFQGPATLTTLLAMAAAAIVVAGGLYATLRFKSVFGSIIVAMTVALLPVLHIIPVDFELSLYHDRYTTMALAMACSMLPMLRAPARLKLRATEKLVSLLAGAGIFLWLAFSIVAIRLITPNWANDTALWNWALSAYPHSTIAKTNLLTAYVTDKDYQSARKLGDRVLADPTSCVTCMLKIAELAVNQGDPNRAAFALERARRSPLINSDKKTLHGYYLLTGKMLILQGKPDDAENVLREALSLVPDDPLTKQALASITTARNQAPQAR